MSSRCLDFSVAVGAVGYWPRWLLVLAGIGAVERGQRELADKALSSIHRILPLITHAPRSFKRG